MHNELERVGELVAPIASDLELDVYDVERRGGTVRITLDTPAGSTEGLRVDTLALATRLISRELDHQDPIGGRYTLEVTSPGLERPLRTAAHFQREVGKDVLVRLRNAPNDDRRVRGVLVSADDTAASVRDADGTEHRVDYTEIDKARVVFDFDSAKKTQPANTNTAARGSEVDPQMDKENQPS